MNSDVKATNTKENKTTSVSATDEYMKQLRQWSQEKEKYYWMWHQYLTMQMHALNMHMMNQASSRLPPPPPPAPPNQNFTQPPPPPQNIPQNKEYTVPSIIRRAFAETADFVLLLILKTIGLVYVMNLLGFNIHVQSNEILGWKVFKFFQEDFLTDNWEEIFRDNFTDEDLELVENELSMLLSATILYRILTGIYEWLFIWLLGFTPGKLLFGLKVVSCSAVTQIRPNIVSVTPGTPATFAGALIRSLVKNLMIALMIPAFFTAIFNRYKRTTYDELSRTIVVRHQPLLRNR